MMKVRILIEPEIRQCVSLDMEALEAVAAAFSKLAAGEAVVPPVLRIDIPLHHGEVDVKTAYLLGLDHFAIKIASGFFGNHQLGLANRQRHDGGDERGNRFCRSLFAG